jgi:nucleotide-binding universal stress UspA family protein
MKLQVGNLEVGLIITPLDEHHRQFMAERVTGENDPVILTRSTKDLWLIENPGEWTIPDDKFQELGKMIGSHFHKIDHIKNILMLTDFSEAAANAARYAAELIHQLGASRLILYHSYGFNPIVMNIKLKIPVRSADASPKSKEQLEDLKNKLETLAGKKTKIEVYADDLPFLYGAQSVAEQQHAGLVVMGITGKSKLARILVGSNTVTMAKASAAPLLIVPQKAKFEKIRRVLFACDSKKLPVSTPVYAIKTFLHKLDAKLVILNMDHPDRDPLDPDTIAGEAALHEQWDSEEPEYHHTDHKDVAKGIMQFADQHDTQLVITVPEKYGFFESLFHRSLTKKLAFHTHIPLLLLKETIN